MNFGTITREQLQTMFVAGREVLDWQRVLAKTGDNIVKELLPTEGTFYEFQHCPPGDIYDRETHSQFYYHAHRKGEHGHFHTFLREKGMPDGVHPVEQSESEAMGQRDDKYCHIVAISMDRKGFPIGLFTTNRWVTGENWYAADDVCAILDCFNIDHAQPSWATNRWVSAMLRLFRPQIMELLHERDAVVADWRKRHKDKDAYEDRGLDLPSHVKISVERQMRGVEDVLTAHDRAISSRLRYGRAGHHDGNVPSRNEFTWPF